MGFMDDYEPVDDRIHKFWAKHPEGRIATELIFDADARVVFLAQIWRTQGDGRPDSTGWSEERQASSKINKMGASIQDLFSWQQSQHIHLCGQSSSNLPWPSR